MKNYIYERLNTLNEMILTMRNEIGYKRVRQKFRTVFFELARKSEKIIIKNCSREITLETGRYYSINYTWCDKKLKIEGYFRCLNIDEESITIEVFSDHNLKADILIENINDVHEIDINSETYSIFENSKKQL